MLEFLKDITILVGNRLMKIKLAIITLFLCVAAAHSDIILGAPSVPAGSRVAAQIPFLIDYSIDDCYKFVFMGIQAKGNTIGTPKQSNSGQINLKASAWNTSSNLRIHEGNLYFRDIENFNSAPLKTLLTVPNVVFRATDAPMTVFLRWQGNGNAHKPNGWFNILGEYQKNPPPPIGTLQFATGDYLLINAGEQLKGKATIVRE